MTTRNLENQEMTKEQLSQMGVKEPPIVEQVDEEVKEDDGLVEGISFGEDSNKKVYLIFFIYADEEGNDVKDWELITGRNNFYEFVKQHAETMDMLNSKALTGTLTIKDAVCVADIIRSFKEQGMYLNDGFNIEEYI